MFISIVWYTLKMAVSTTETCRWVATREETRCIKAHSLIFCTLNFFIFQNILTASGAHPPPQKMNIVESIPGIKRPGREADQTSPSIAELRMTAAEPPLPPLVFVGRTGRGSSWKRNNCLFLCVSVICRFTEPYLASLCEPFSEIQCCVHTLTLTYALILKLYFFTYNLSKLRHVWIYDRSSSGSYWKSVQNM
jgi:hypothetical protein